MSEIAFAKRLRSQRRNPPRLSRRALMAPQTGLVRQKYDAAQTTSDNTRHWANADSFGPNAAVDPGVRATLRNRSRYEVANDCYANGIVKTLVTDTIGSGPTLQTLLPGDKTANELVETLFWKWSVAAELPRKLKTMRRAKCVDGETFAVLAINPQLPNRVKLDIRVCEAEMVASPWGVLDRGFADGLVVDDFGNVVGYTVLKQHPGESFVVNSGRDAETISAQYMLHLFDQDRPGQYRGVPEITPALPLFAMRRAFALAVLDAARNAANISWVMKTHDPSVVPGQVNPLDPIETYRNMGVALPDGYDMAQFKSEQPQDTYDLYTKALIREVAKCVNMPLNVAAGDSSGYNYASGRMDHQVYFKAIDVERSYLETHCLDRIFGLWWIDAIVRHKDILPSELTRSSEPPAHVWRWDGREHVDPLKEANAEKVGLANGTLSRSAAYAKRGLDVDEQDAIAARDYNVTVAEYRTGLFLAQIAPPVAAISSQSSKPEERDEE